MDPRLREDDGRTTPLLFPPEIGGGSFFPKISSIGIHVNRRGINPPIIKLEHRVKIFKKVLAFSNDITYILGGDSP